MSENVGMDKYMGLAYESGFKKIGENIANRALNFVVDKVQQKYSEKKIELGTAFERYIENACNRLNKVKTLATGKDPRNIIGENELYVKIGVDYKGVEIDTSSVDSLLKVSDNILILGSGGVGKSMLMRYLFLNTALYGNYIPVFVELRKISSQSAGNVSIEKLIEDCMAQFDVKLPEDEFVYSLRLGKYLFLLDGFDEVKDELALEAADKIQQFCVKYPNNKCIVTTRNDDYCYPFETFTQMQSKPLNKKQAVELASKLCVNDDRTTEFCRQLDEELYEKHESFAENPLLLSMMFLTFMRNLSIPDHLAEFYKKAYEALYSLHDSRDKGYFRRDFKCIGLDEEQFRILFARFCFQTYYIEKYEFKKAEILEYIKESAEFLNFDIDEKAYLVDLQKAVCLIVEDGTEYRFAHRSFQAYFAAVYTSERLTDIKQKQLFKGLLSNKANYHYEDFFDLLNQIEHDRFTVNALEDGLRELMKEADESDDPDIFFLKQQFSRVIYNINQKRRIDQQSYDNKEQKLSKEPLDKEYYKNKYADLFLFFGVNHSRNSYNLIYTFTQYTRYFYHKSKYFDKSIDVSFVIYMIDYIKNIPKKDPRGVEEFILFFEELDKSNEVSDADKKKFYDILIRYRRIPLLRKRIKEWLDDLDKERANLSKDDFYKSF